MISHRGTLFFYFVRMDKFVFSGQCGMNKSTLNTPLFEDHPSYLFMWCGVMWCKCCNHKFVIMIPCSPALVHNMVWFLQKFAPCRRLKRAVKTAISTVFQSFKIYNRLLSFLPPKPSLRFIQPQRRRLGGLGGRRPPPKEKEKKKRIKEKEKKEKKKEGNYEWCQITTYKVLFFSNFSIVWWHWKMKNFFGPSKKKLKWRPCSA